MTIYDLKITCTWQGLDSEQDGTPIKGTITAVEVSHDMEEDDYVFETAFDDAAVHTNSKEAQALKEDVRVNLSKGLRAKFQQFPKAMIEAHGKDLLAAAAADSAASNGISVSAPQPTEAKSVSSSGTHAPSRTVAATEKSPATGINTSKVRAEGDFMAVSAILPFKVSPSEFHPSLERTFSSF